MKYRYRFPAFEWSEGPPAIAKAALGILSVAALPGAVFGSLLVKSAALLVALFAVTALGLILLADRNTLRRELEEHRELVTHYCSHTARGETVLQGDELGRSVRDR